MHTEGVKCGFRRMQKSALGQLQNIASRTCLRWKSSSTAELPLPQRRVSCPARAAVAARVAGTPCASCRPCATATAATSRSIVRGAMVGLRGDYARLTSNELEPSYLGRHMEASSF
eukprot:6210328-Pleurochrysis_carterae.AAC.1